MKTNTIIPNRMFKKLYSNLNVLKPKIKYIPKMNIYQLNSFVKQASYLSNKDTTYLCKQITHEIDTQTSQAGVSNIFIVTGATLTIIFTTSFVVPIIVAGTIIFCNQHICDNSFAQLMKVHDIIITQKQINIHS